MKNPCGKLICPLPKLATIFPKSAAATNGLAMAELLRGDLDAARRGFLQSLDLEPRSIGLPPSLA